MDKIRIEKRVDRIMNKIKDTSSLEDIRNFIYNELSNTYREGFVEAANYEP